MSVALPPAAALSSRAPGVDILVIAAPDFHAEISLQGGQLLGFRTAGQQPLLYLSPQAVFQPGKAIRGGVPLCWPWFGPHPDDASLPAHGVARTHVWRLDEVREDAGAFHVKLSGPERDGLSAEIEYHLGATLQVALTTRNHGDRPQRLSAALHSYLAVGDATQASLSGQPARAATTRWPTARAAGRTPISISTAKWTASCTANSRPSCATRSGTVASASQPTAPAAWWCGTQRRKKPRG